MLRVLLAVLLSVVVAMPALHAQPAPLLDAGTRVRIQASRLGSKVREGILLSMNTDTLVVKLDGRADSARIGLSDVTGLARLKTNSSGAGTEIVIGLVGGAAFGAFFGAVSAQPRRVCNYDQGNHWVCNDIAPDKKRYAREGAQVLSLVGAIVGAVAGSLNSTEWVPIDIGGKKRRVSLAPTQARGAVFAVSF
jgi:hypothetical protein